MTATTTVNVQTHAADELIAVTGEKSIDRQWDLADALLSASPGIYSDELAAIRQAAVDKAGHDEFWKVPRLRQLAQSAQGWPKADRIPDVALDTHLEALRKKGSLVEAKKLIADAGKTSKVPGKPSIREVRTAAGANGTTATPPRVDKADAGELVRRLFPRGKELKEYLRKNLRAFEKEIVEFSAIFVEAEQKVVALAGTRKAPAPIVVAGTKAERRTKVKGL